MNLLKETIQKLEENRKTPEDVLWCGSEEFGYFTWSDFLLMANREYDSGYGGQEVATDLRIVGKDWWLERHEYDGSEWWEFKSIPKKPKTKNIGQVLSREDSWATIKELNQPGGKYGDN